MTVFSARSTLCTTTEKTPRRTAPIHMCNTHQKHSLSPERKYYIRKELNMDADLLIRLKYELKQLEHDREIYAKRLEPIKGYRSYKLRRNVHADGKVYYYFRKEKESVFSYLGKDTHPIVRNIQEAHRLDAAIKAIDKNIKSISNLLQDYKSYDEQSINSALHKAYRGSLIPQSDAYSEASRKWKEEMQILLDRFPENYPDNKTEHASDGTMLKTVSELVAYERLIGSGLATIYELPLPSNDYRSPLYPDFTVLSPIDFKTTIIIEYVGRLDLQAYREAFSYRINRYMKNGYIPGVNLFFVFGDEDGHIDSMQLNRIIADIKGLPID